MFDSFYITIVNVFILIVYLNIENRPPVILLSNSNLIYNLEFTLSYVIKYKFYNITSFLSLKLHTRIE